MTLVAAATAIALLALGMNIVAALAILAKRKQVRRSLLHARLEMVKELRGSELKELRRAIEAATKAERRERVEANAADHVGHRQSARQAGY